MIKFDGEAFKKKAMTAALDAVTRKIEGIRCPVHGKKAKVAGKMDGTNFTWDVSGCCDELVAKVRAALKAK
jgi:hypothetical protein